MKTGWISSENLISEYVLKYKTNKYFDEDLAYMFADDAVDMLLTADSCKVYYALVDLNYQGNAALPSNYKYPLSAFYRDTPESAISHKDTQLSVSEWIDRSYGEFCDVKVQVDCRKCKNAECTCTKPIEINATETILRSNPQFMTGYTDYLIGYSEDKRSYIHDDFVKINATENYLHSLPSEIQGCNLPIQECPLEYSINNKVIDVNRPNGQVLIAYLGYRIDSKGFMMIPNEPFVFRALQAFMIAEFALIAYTQEQNGPTERFWRNMDMNSRRLMNRAKSKLRIPDMDEWDKLMSNIWMKRVPFRGNYGQTEKDRYNPGKFTLGHGY